MELYRKTPLMGWASWNCFRTNISEEILKEQMNALISTGLAEAGYCYFNVDDGFFGGRDEKGRLLFHKKRFPNGIKVIADYAHENGLKAGIYSDGGDNTCGFYYDHEGDDGIGVGLYQHEEDDLHMFLDEFGFDFIKVDWCGGLRLGLEEQEQYTKIGEIIDQIRHKTGRCLVFNVCRWQFPGEWVVRVADSWRTGSDITPDFDSVMHQIDNIKPLAKYTGPGHVNDLDMMQIGNGLSLVEEKTHFSMWCMMSTPLMIGCDLTKIQEETLKILKNKEMIAVNQDAACLQAVVVNEFYSEEGQLLGEIWVKDLGKKGSNEKAIAFLNRSSQEISMKLSLSEVGLDGKILFVRDLWEHKECSCEGQMAVSIKAHDVKVYKVVSENGKNIKFQMETKEYSKKEIMEIDLEQARKLMEQGAVLVDVREPEAYEREHLEGAVNVPYTDIHGLAQSIWKDKEKTMIIYCTTGKRSTQAIGTLELLGYSSLYRLRR